MTRAPVTETDLHAYVDGRLDAARRAEVEAHLAAHEADARTVRELQSLNRQLHESFDDVLNQPLPPAMLKVPRRSWMHSLTRATAALVLLVVGAAAGWGLNDFVSSQQDPVAAAFPERAGIVHAIYAREKRHAVEVPAGEKPHLVAWLTNRLGTQVILPDLTEEGFALVGGRLLPGETKPAAHFLYEDVQGRRVTLYMRHGDTGGGDKRFAFASQNGVGVYYWIDGPRGYAIAGSVDREELLRLSKRVYQQIDP